MLINNSGASHYSYNSVQTHTSVIRGKRSETTEAVSVRNGKGSKTVKKRVGKKVFKKQIPLTRSEIMNIKNRKFMPEFFHECHSCVNNSLASKKTRVQKKGKGKPRITRKTKK
jgi:hypothetical protein